MRIRIPRMSFPARHWFGTVCAFVGVAKMKMQKVKEEGRLFFEGEVSNSWADGNKC